MNIIDTEVVVTPDVMAISIEIEYPEFDMIEHDMMYIMYEANLAAGEPSEGGVTFDEAYDLALKLTKLNQ